MLFEIKFLHTGTTWTVLKNEGLWVKEWTLSALLLTPDLLSANMSLAPQDSLATHGAKASTHPPYLNANS